jgi:hypothetical protein
MPELLQSQRNGGGDVNRLEDFLIPSQGELFCKLRGMFKGRAVCSDGNYILVPGDAPILLLAHLDTVHRDKVRQICKTEDGNILMSPQGIGGDDRCGVYALVQLRRAAEKKPWLLFTCDEETGGGGALAFCRHFKEGKLPKELEGLKLLVELDRKGGNDAVYYDCANGEFEDYITGKGFKTEQGSFSDISYVAPELGVAAVNLSAGYHNAHTIHETINRAQLNAVINKVGEIIADAAKPGFPTYEYVKACYDWRGCYGDIYWPKSAAKTVLSGEYAGNYIALLDFYTSAELDALRDEYGDQIIETLYESEIGG